MQKQGYLEKKTFSLTDVMSRREIANAFDAELANTINELGSHNDTETFTQQRGTS